MRTTTSCEVAVVGAGPAGAATTVALRSEGVDRVVVLDQGRGPGRPPLGESIPPESRLLLDRLGAWPAFMADGHEPCLGTWSSWGSDDPGYDDFVSNAYGHGWHLDRARFDACLLGLAVDRGARLLPRARVLRVATAGEGFVVHTDAGATIAARFVVDATGQAATVAHALGARRKVVHRLTAAAGFLTLPGRSPLSRMTMLEAVDYGWWYAARVPGGRAAAVVATDARIVTARALHTRAGWTDHLRGARHLGAALDGATLDAGRVHVRSVPSMLLEPCAADGWAAVGDAASTFDPLASQGIVKALADGLDAAAAIADWLQDRPYGLRRYREGVEVRFHDYRRTRAYFYGVERRWPAAPFWRARHAPS